MDKEEILKKSRKENLNGDEREHQVKDRSMMWAYIFMVVVSAAFRLFDITEDAPIMDFSAAIASSACAATTYRFIKTKTVMYLILAIVMLGLTVLSTVRFFMGH